MGAISRWHHVSKAGNVPGGETKRWQTTDQSALGDVLSIVFIVHIIKASRVLGPALQRYMCCTAVVGERSMQRSMIGKLYCGIHPGSFRRGWQNRCPAANFVPCFFPPMAQGLYWLTDSGEDIFTAQYIFTGLYVSLIMLVLSIYRLAGRKSMPFWSILLVCASRRSGRHRTTILLHGAGRSR